MMKPSEIADMLLEMARQEIISERNKEVPGALIDTFNLLIQGLQAMNTGMRATYIKLMEVERLVQRLEGTRR